MTPQRAIKFLEFCKRNNLTLSNKQRELVTRLKKEYGLQEELKTF